MTDEKNSFPAGEDEVAVRNPPINSAFEMNQGVFTQKARKVGPKPARQHALLDEIDASLARIVADAAEIVEDDRGDIFEVNGLSPTEIELIGVAATLATLLREAWTYS
jgi:hypothetical protein